MQPATLPSDTTDDAVPTGLGSEYMDARSYLAQPERPRPVVESGPGFHGSNESDFGLTRIGPDE
jgi:hypothetical protein